MGLLQDPQHQIRLLRLLPGGEDDISLELAIHDFIWPDDSRLQHDSYGNYGGIPFYAISYTWGDNDDVCEIVINGTTRSVRPNCYHALRQARLHHPGSQIWIDSLCIDQENAVEKGHQVSIMGKIFASAKTVLACMGPQQDDCDFLFKILDEFATRSQKQHNHSIKGVAAEYTWGNFWRDRTTFEKQRCEDACQAFMDRPYWRRLWIIQEIVRAASLDILCGDISVPWKFVEDVYNFQVAPEHSVWSASFLMMHSLRNKPVHGLTLLDCLPEFECTDIRDRIYGVLDLLQVDGARLPTIPDYSISAFDLVVRIIGQPTSIEARDIGALLHALDIQTNNPELQSLVAQRQSPYPPDITARPWLDTQFCATCIPLYRDAIGRLTGSIRPPGHERGREIVDLTSAARGQAMLFETGNDKGRPQNVYIGDQIAAIVCSKARSGDYLAEVISRPPRLYLILRPASTSAFEIIGQGIAVTDILLCNSKFECRCPEHGMQHETLVNRMFKTTLDAEDIAVLFAQDPPRIGRSGLYQIDPLKRARRLITRVSKRPHPIAIMDKTVNAGVAFWEDKTHDLAGRPRAHRVAHRHILIKKENTEPGMFARAGGAATTNHPAGKLEVVERAMLMTTNI